MVESGYYFGFPHRSGEYPNSKDESEIVLERMKNPDMEFFTLSDESPKVPFTDFLREKGYDTHDYELTQIIRKSYPIVIQHKGYYNRPRPAQVNSSIQPAESKTAATPSYPAGHTFQAYLMAYHLSNKYPKHRGEFFRIANRIADARVSVGLHYPSDNEGGIALAEKYEDKLSAMCK
tara:strand:+ start:3099 stop:3629 length:531 start_codon:yes stop_codon:yes gene_type:complete